MLFAPGYDAVATEALVQKPGVRILNDLERRAFEPAERDLSAFSAASSSRTATSSRIRSMRWRSSAATSHRGMWEDLLFAWTVVKHALSNAIVIARGGQTLGIGAGQMSRVDAVRIAVEKARSTGTRLEGAALASDAFFPFADGAGVALEAGIGAIIQPGGSKRDDEVVAAVRDAGAAMVFTSRRHFRH